MNILRILVYTALIFSSCSNDPVQPGGNGAPPYTQIDSDPVISQDGRGLVYFHSNVDNDFTGLVYFDLVNGTYNLLVNAILSTPDISPAGTEIIFSRDQKIFKVSSSGNNQSVISLNGNCRYPKYNSDGSRILYENSDCGSGCGIRIINSDGSMDSLVIAGGRSPEWTNVNGEFIYLTPAGSGGGDSLYRFSFNTGIKTFLALLASPDHKVNQYLNFTNNEVIFCSTSDAGYTYVYKLSLNTGGIFRLADNQGWSPHFSYATGEIYYTNRNEGEGRIWIMNIDGSGNRLFDEIY
ncbi:MAG: hypothetical protein IPM96_05725 [Ignavibacteria bacterium]|nr:hypothetical protein [Ignavibacteria bacterium]